jgi:TPR repeat protein
MSVSKLSTARALLDPANAALNGQARVNAEIFTAVEILGRKLERAEAERDRLTRRLALFESAASVDEKTGKLYLPVVMDQPLPPQNYAAPKWVVSASLMSSAIALFALGLVLFRDPVSPLTQEQIAALNSLHSSQFASIAPESKGWKSLDDAQPETAIVAAAEPVQPAEAVPPAPPQNELAVVTVPPVATPVAPQPVKVAVKAAEPKLEKIDIPSPAPAIPKVAVVKAPVAVPAPAPKVAEKKITPVPVVAAALPAAPETVLSPDPALPAKMTALEKRAFQGIAEAQHDLATLYASGKLVAQNYPRAIYWFSKAADGGVANAHYNLGVIYQQGLGAPVDMPKALGWYEKAAELGHPEAMYNLGIAYIEGVGTKTDIDKGVSYFKRAAKAGVAQAAFNLGVLYESNFIGPIDKDKAIEWYQVAANEGHAGGREALARLKNANADTAVAQSSDDQALKLATEVEPAAGTKTSNVNSPAAKPPAQQAAEVSLLAGIQRELIRQGLLPGAPDGVMTPQVEDAIRAAQKRFGIATNGQPSEVLLDKLQQPVATKK